MPFRHAAELPGDERSSRLPLATYPILYPDLVERMVVFCLSEFDTPACIPPTIFSLGADGNADKVAIRGFGLADR